MAPFKQICSLFPVIFQFLRIEWKNLFYERTRLDHPKKEHKERGASRIWKLAPSKNTVKSGGLPVSEIGNTY